MLVTHGVESGFAVYLFFYVTETRKDDWWNGKVQCRTSYVGRTRRLHRRLAEHGHPTNVVVFHVRDWEMAGALERYLIDKLRPVGNTLYPQLRAADTRVAIAYLEDWRDGLYEQARRLEANLWVSTQWRAIVATGMQIDEPAA